MTNTTAPHAAAERHASWAELFFDLVAIAGVGTLAHVLVEDVGPRSLGLYALLFLAFWLVWTAYTLYGNVAAGSTVVVRLLVGMFGLGVMAAAVPGVAHVVLDDGHASRALNVFAVAYVLTRVFASQSWRRGEVLLDFPAAQHVVGVLPWIVSLWVDEPLKLWLWALGVAIDLLVVLVIDGDQMLEAMLGRLRDQEASGRRQRQRGGEQLVIRGVSVDRSHLEERLGLFVIIVLGEGVIQVVHAASETELERGVLGAGLASFVLLAGMFGLSVVYGYAGVPHLRAGSLPMRAALSLHCVVSGVIATVAVSLAAVLEHGHEPLDTDQRWLLCGAVTAYFALGLVASVAARGFRPAPAALWLVTGVGVPVLLGLFGDEITGPALVAYVALVVLGHLLGQRRAEQHAPAPAAPVAP